MKKLLPVFMIAVLIPQLAFASWWDPTSWFKEKPKMETSTPSEEIPEDNSEVFEKEKTTTEKVVTSENQKLNQEISKLREENQLWQSRYYDLEKKLNQCTIGLDQKDQTQTIVDKTEVDAEKSKSAKLAEIDSKVLAKYDELMHLSNLTDQRAKDLIDWLNTYIYAYKVIDPNVKITELKYPEYYAKPLEATNNFKVELDLYIKYR